MVGVWRVAPLVWSWLACGALAGRGLAVPGTEPGPRAIPEAERRRCHHPRGRRHHQDCIAYTTEIDFSYTSFGPGGSEAEAQWEACFNLTWQDAVAAKGDAAALGSLGDWGSCVQVAASDGYRYAVSNSVPNLYFGPYCPLGIGLGYCVPGDEECAFDNLTCGDEATAGSSAGFTALGDVWVPFASYFKVPLVGDPTRQGLPVDMYEVVGDGRKNIGAATGFTLENGVSIQGPNDAGNYNIDEAGFVLPCGGHVTPPTDALGADDDLLAVPPMFHYHKAPDCLQAFVSGNKPVSHGGQQDEHGLLFGYALDGFGIYTFTDVGGAAPVLDECGGHFGPTDDADQTNVSYHYHATAASPYHLACQGPALGRCSTTQFGVDFCGVGCGAQVCAQPGTAYSDLEAYVGTFNSTWLSAYSTNLDMDLGPV